MTGGQCLTMAVRFSSVMGLRVSTTEMYPSRWAMARAVFPFWAATDPTGSYSQETKSIHSQCVCASVFVHWPRWARWPRPRAEAAGWWCGCGPAELPGVEECIRSGHRWTRNQRQKINIHVGCVCERKIWVQSGDPAASVYVSTLVLPLTLARFCSRKFAIFALP